MANATKQEIRLFYCYAREDKPLRDELEKHLAWLTRRYHLINWHDREIMPGQEWEQAINEQLNTAHIILLLVSPDFMASDYIYGKEMRRALERHKEGTCRVIPILLRPTYWEGAPFSSLQLLPTNARAITSWPNPDEAFQDVVTEISRTIKDLLGSLKIQRGWLEEGDVLSDLEQYEAAPAAYEQTIRTNSYDLYLLSSSRGSISYRHKDYEEALSEYERAIHYDPNNTSAYNMKGQILRKLERYEEALVAYEQAIRLDPNSASAYNGKGNILLDLKRYEEALAAYEQAIRLNPNHAYAYNGKGNSYRHLKRNKAALAAYEQAIHISPNYANAYNGKGNVLFDLKHYEEALAAYERAIHLNPNYANAYSGKGNALNALKRYEEAENAFEQARQLGI